jgi:hypothetical protein
MPFCCSALQQVAKEILSYYGQLENSVAHMFVID